MPSTLRALIVATAVLVLLIAATAGTGAASERQIVQVTLKDFQVQLSQFVVTPGKPVQFVVTNEGAVPHQFNVQLYATPGAIQAEEGSTIAPGTIRVVERTLDPGVYRVACPIGDHTKWGMLNVLSAQSVPDRAPPVRPEFMVPFLILMLGGAYIIADSTGLRLFRRG